MRDFINIVESLLTEGVSFHPAVMEIHDGEKYIHWPPGATQKTSEPCPGCEYHREWIKDWDSANCEDCYGEGEIHDEVMTCPHLDVSNFQSSDIANMLGHPEEHGDHTGWITPQELPVVMRRLIALKNGDTSQYTHDGEITGGDTYVDRSGDVPRIAKHATVIGGGRDQSQIDRYIDRLISIVQWAQQHGCGLSWA